MSEENGESELTRGQSSDPDASRRALTEVRSVADALQRIEAEVGGTSKVATEVWSELAGIRAKVDAILETSANETGGVSALLDEVRETLQDLASGEVVGALWDEVRSMRAEIASAGPGGGRLPEEVAQLNASVRDLLDHAEVVDEGAIADEGAPLGALAADVAALRDELAAGLVVEASDDLGAALDTVHTDLEAIKARLDQPLELAADEPETASGEAVSAVVDQLATLRDFASAEFSALRQIYESRGDVDLTPLTARLDRLHDELGEVQEAASGGAAGPAVDLDAVHEALADIQAGLANLLDRPVPAAEPAEAAEATGDTYATVDPDVVDLLREEIRASGQPAEELIDALNTELKALRRRIRLRAEGEIFTDEQLELIAESVARRLAADDS